MDILKNFIDYIFSFEAYVLLPIILFIISLIFRISLKKAFELSLIVQGRSKNLPVYLAFP